MKPSELETTIQDTANDLIQRMQELTKSKDETIALRATQYLLNKGYGENGRTKRDPWDSEKKQKGVAAMLNSIFNDGEGTPADSHSVRSVEKSDKIEGKGVSSDG